MAHAIWIITKICQHGETNQACDAKGQLRKWEDHELGIYWTGIDVIEVSSVTYALYMDLV